MRKTRLDKARENVEFCKKVLEMNPPQPIAAWLSSFKYQEEWMIKRLEEKKGRARRSQH